MPDDDRSIGRSDLDECWCCDGLHDAPGPRCPPCREAGCPHFGGACQSDHQPVRPDGGFVGDSDPYDHPIKEILDRHDVDHYVSPDSYSITQESLPAEVLTEIAEHDCYLYFGGNVAEGGIHLDTDSDGVADT